MQDYDDDDDALSLLVLNIRFGSAQFVPSDRLDVSYGDADLDGTKTGEEKNFGQNLPLKLSSRSSSIIISYSGTFFPTQNRLASSFSVFATTPYCHCHKIQV